LNISQNCQSAPSQISLDFFANCQSTPSQSPPKIPVQCLLLTPNNWIRAIIWSRFRYWSWYVDKDTSRL